MTMPDMLELLGGRAVPEARLARRQPMPDVLAILGDASYPRRPPVEVSPATDAESLARYRSLRRSVFVAEQGLFDRDDRDDFDDDPRTVALVARDHEGTVLGGVRLHPAIPGEPDVGWWLGSRLAVRPSSRHGTARPGPPARMGTAGSVGRALVRAACAYAEDAGVLRFEASVQASSERMFRRLGWESVRPAELAGRPHVLMRWPIRRIAAAAAGKAALGELVAGLAGPSGFVGDDGAPVPGSDLIAACDAILPTMVERDPEWAGWCAVLVNMNDLCAMGAVGVGLLDALGARDASFAARVLAGLRRASAAYDVPVLGGHTQLGVPAAVAVTALGRVPSRAGGHARPVPGGGGKTGQEIRVTVDLAGAWRPGFPGQQWDSTSCRSPAELQAMVRCLADSSRSRAGGGVRPSAAKDVSMAGIAGTLGMLAEASGCGAILDVARVPRPPEASAGDWLTCFPGFGLVTAAWVGTPLPAAGPATSSACGSLIAGAGVRLRWPDGVETVAIGAGVTGLGAAAGNPGECEAPGPMAGVP